MVNPSPFWKEKGTVHSARFIEVVGDFFEGWFKFTAFRIAAGQIKIAKPYSYPTTLRVGESPSHHIAELLGFTDISSPPDYRLRRPKKPERCPTTSSFFNPGLRIDHGKAALKVSIPRMSFVCLSLCTTYDEEIFLRKINFPISDLRIISENADVPLIISPSADCLLFYYVDLIRTDSVRVLFRTISTAIVVKKATRESELLDWLSLMAQRARSNAKHPYIIGLNIGFDSSSESFARQLASLSDQNVTESILDEFIQAHAAQFASALGYKRALSQTALQWVEREPDDPEVSKPDYLMEREDGYFDILDLKKAALRYKSVTLGKKARLRFNSYVSELIAQLDGYERYFDNKANREWAIHQYGVRLKKPRLIGVVGNYDNFIRKDVDLALEQYKDNIVILSYKDIIDLLRKKSSVAFSGRQDLSSKGP